MKRTRDNLINYNKKTEYETISNRETMKRRKLATIWLVRRCRGAWRWTAWRWQVQIWSILCRVRCILPSLRLLVKLYSINLCFIDRFLILVMSVTFSRILRVISWKALVTFTFVLALVSINGIPWCLATFEIRRYLDLIIIKLDFN